MKRLLFLLSLAVLIPQPSQAMPISAFFQHPQSEQHIYALGALSMMVFTEGINGHKARMLCINDWYLKGHGEQQFFDAMLVSPATFKARFGFDWNSDIGHVELVLTRMANDACPK